jgi:hypothetical protein
MTFSDLIREAGEMGARMNSVQSDIRPFILRAIRQIAQRHNFTWMHSRQTATITSGTTSANLHARFKELTPEASPITYTAPTAQFPTPVIVKTREELERTGPGINNLTVNASGYWSPFYVFLEQNDGGLWTINTASGYTQPEAATYSYSCYLFPADLSAATDTNGVTNDAELAEASVFLAVAMALLKQDASDARGIAAQQAAEPHIRRAISQDAHRRLAGRIIRW